jgi:hypothetical protein
MSLLDMVRAAIADKGVGDDLPKVKSFLERELLPWVTEMRTKYNAFVEWPTISMFTGAITAPPITDLTFDPTGLRKPRVGAIARATDNKLYVRIGEGDGLGEYVGVPLADPPALSDVAGLPVVSPGAASAGVVARSAREDHTHAAPHFIVSSLADLPEPDDDGVITISEAGDYYFPGLIDGDGVRLDALSGVRLYGGGFTTSHASPAVRVRNSTNNLPFSVGNSGGGAAVEPFTLDAQSFDNWDVIGDVLCGSPTIVWNGGRFSVFTIPNGVATARVSNAFGRVKLAGAGAVGGVSLLNVFQAAGSDPLCWVDAGIRVTGQILVQGCQATGQLFKCDADINDSGALPNVNLIGSRSMATNSIECGAVPAGGLAVLGGAYAGFLGFDETTAFIRAVFDATGAPFPETPITP